MTGALSPLPFKRRATGAYVPLHNSFIGNFIGKRVAPFSKGATGVEVPFRNRIIGNFMVYKIDLKQIYCSYSRTHKIHNGFLRFLLLFEVNVVAAQKQA